MTTVALIIGTRPEAVKMAPVHFALSRRQRLHSLLVSTGQHGQLLSDVLEPLGLKPDHELDIMSPGQTLNGIIIRVIERMTLLLEQVRPRAVLVQGDTSTALAAALASYHLRIPIGHVEAGLRTYDFDHPFPEEANRQLIDRLASWCFVPTTGARDNLIAERVPCERIHVTGNTVVDALLLACTRTTYRCKPETLLLTLHRRESFGDPLRAILEGVARFLEETPGANVLWPVHPNPAVAAALKSAPGFESRIDAVPPMDYVSFAGALATCKLVLTDSGGIQEEAPSLGKMVLVARETTERPEGLTIGRNRLVGRCANDVRSALLEAWAAPPYTGSIPAPNPFGDGCAGERIATALETLLTN